MINFYELSREERVKRLDALRADCYIITRVIRNARNFASGEKWACAYMYDTSCNMLLDCMNSIAACFDIDIFYDHVIAEETDDERSTRKNWLDRNDYTDALEEMIDCVETLDDWMTNPISEDTTKDYLGVLYLDLRAFICRYTKDSNSLEEMYEFLIDELGEARDWIRSMRLAKSFDNKQLYKVLDATMLSLAQVLSDLED